MATAPAQDHSAATDHTVVSHRAPRRSIASYLLGGLANLLAAGGVVAVGLVIAAVTMNISLIMFKTGSMSPTIPTGSVAAVKEISADAIEVGDVVTVDREERLPVTHRVIEVHPQVPGEALIRMQGDANPNPDEGMYRVQTVRKVLWSVPDLANVIVWASNPLVLGSITMLASLGVFWAFWPRGEDDEPVQIPAPESDDV
ncbi:signal peptidase I [Dietzia kunjamensis]|uniref:signal peptidase I n=1 Tax=Dietzia kunjamensis TaxID=322509 RepID=UPI002DBF8A72|nr:signal peptidase I [Dietzia kunjamensis]MEB8325947.1 signal peptidase I [Dietzia kunjamensis]